jgi:hypothetical protein
MDRFSNPFEGFSVPVWASSLEPHFERKGIPMQVHLHQSVVPLRFLRKKKGLKFQIELGVKTRPLNQSKFIARAPNKQA